MRAGETRRAPIARPPRRQAGFTYFALLFAIAIAGVALAEAGIAWHTAQQRERERDLLFVGNEIRQAIGRYYSAGGGQYPQQLADLLRDPRQPGVVRYLRKIYHDPITGSTEWGLIKDGADRIIGVYSPSTTEPIKHANFSDADAAFADKPSYADWAFVYVPPRVRGKNASVTTPKAPGVGR